MENLNEHDFMFIERFLLSFKALGGNADGLINYELFKSHLRQKGDGFKEMLQLINEEECVKDNSLDYFKLCASILATKACFNFFSVENGRVRNAHGPINTHTYTRKKSTSLASVINSSTDENTNSEIFREQIGGAVYNVNNDFLSNRYHMEVLESSWIEIYAKAVNCQGNVNVPIEILIFQEKSKALHVSSSFINAEGCCAVKFHFKKGKYVIVPIVLNWYDDRTKSSEAVNLAYLIDLTDDGHVELTPACEKALRTVFDTIDLDQNGLLSQLEFDLFIQHTSGETAADEWSTIEDNFKMEDHQLTYDGFLELYKMVLQTDPADVTNMFQLMGMNELLQHRNAQPFTVFIESETSKFLLSPLPVSSYSIAVEKGLCKTAVEHGVSKKVKNMNDLFLYTLKLPQRVTVVIQNQSHSKVRVRLDCTRSTNCRSHRNTLDYTVEVPPRTSIVGHHLVPLDPGTPWNVECIEELK